MKAFTAGLYFLLFLLVLLAFNLSSIDGKYKRKMISNRGGSSKLSNSRSSSLTEKAKKKILSSDQPPIDEESTAEIKGQMEELLSSINETIAKCAAKKADLKALAGEWKMAFYKKPRQRKSVAIHLEYTSWEDVHMLIGSLKEAGNERDYVIQLLQLKQVDQPAILFSLLPVGEHIIKLPVLLVDSQPDRYFTVFQTGLLLPDYIDWAVYVRPGVRLSRVEVKKATAGLRCLNMEEGEEEEGGGDEGPVVFPVGKMQ